MFTNPKIARLFVGFDVARIYDAMDESGYVALTNSMGESSDDLATVIVEMGLDECEAVELVELLAEDKEDFMFNDYRFISADVIDDIQQRELKDDLWMLGCFNASSIASHLPIDIEVIETMQEAEAYEAVGKLIISLGALEDMQEEYARLDGYGHHFAHYDHNTHELSLNSGDWFMFRTN